MKKRVLLIEDEKSIAEALLFTLSKEGLEVEWASTGADGLDKVKTKDPNLVILDIGLPDTDGLSVCRAIRAFSEVPIVFLTARSEEVDKIIGLELGADDYVTKPFSSRELLARVKSVMRRTVVSAPNIRQKPGHRTFLIDEERMRILVNGTPLELSRYEFRLLAVFLKRPGKVFSREELMTRAWEQPDMSLERTIDTHIKTLRHKIREIDPSTEWIVTHRGLGYSLQES